VQSAGREPASRSLWRCRSDRTGERVAARWQTPETPRSKPIAFRALCWNAGVSFCDRSRVERQYERAIQEYRKALELEATTPQVRSFIARALAQHGMMEAATGEIDLASDSLYERTARAQIHALSGRRAPALEAQGGSSETRALDTSWPR
jgi:hypothetical protein